MAHPQHAIPLVLADGEIRAGRARAGDRAVELGAVRFREYDLFDERRHAVFRGVARERSRRFEHASKPSPSGIASLLVVVAIPFLGALSDVRRRRKPWVVGFTVLSCVACALMGVLGQRCCRSPAKRSTRRRRCPPAGTRAARRSSGCSPHSSSPTSRTRPRNRSTTR